MKALPPLTLEVLSRIKEVSGTLDFLQGQMSWSQRQISLAATQVQVPVPFQVLQESFPELLLLQTSPERGLPQEKGGPVVDGITTILEEGAEVGAGALENYDH